MIAAAIGIAAISVLVAWRLARRPLVVPTRAPVKRAMSADDEVVAIVRNKISGETDRRRLGTRQDVWSRDITIGRNPGCAIRLESDEVCEVQAKVKPGHHHYLEVVEGTVSSVGRTDSTPGASWRISGIGDPEPIEVGPFVVTISTDEVD